MAAAAEVIEAEARLLYEAGFKRVGETKGGLAALQILPADMPRALWHTTPEGRLW